MREVVARARIVLDVVQPLLRLREAASACDSIGATRCVYFDPATFHGLPHPCPPRETLRAERTGLDARESADKHLSQSRKQFRAARPKRSRFVRGLGDGEKII